MAELSYPLLLDSMIEIARLETGTANPSHLVLLAVIEAYEAGRKFTVPRKLQPYFDAAVSKARLELLRNDPERELFERLQAKFAPLNIEPVA